MFISNLSLPGYLAAMLLCIASDAAITKASATPESSRTTINLAAFPATRSLFQHRIDTGSDRVFIACARNETESFQVVVSSPDGTLREVDATVSVLTNQAGDTLASEGIQVFCNAFVPVRIPDPRSDREPGLWADALVPRTNPYNGEPVQGPAWGAKGFTGERFRGRRYDVWQGQQQPIWVDVRVPKDATPGVYRGILTVQAVNADTVHMPVEVQVWNFALPDGPTLENHFGGFERIAAYYGLALDSDEFRLLEDRYIEMMVAHRINPPLPRRLLPQVADNGSVSFDNDLDRRIVAFMSRHHATNVEVPRAPFRDALGQDREKAARYYRSWYAYLQRKRWSDRAYVYMYDEPLRDGNYDQVRRLGAFMKEAEPRLRRLVVEAPYPRKPEWGTLDGSLDIWCALFPYIDEASFQRVLRAGDEVWLYTALVQSVPRFHPDYENVKEPEGPHWAADRSGRPPYWQIDFPLIGYRIAPWLNRRYGATGLLYWSSCFWGKKPQNPWDNPTYGDHWNGEGFLLYPGIDAGIEGPVASTRLKNLRDGMEDYEYLALLAKLGGDDVANEIVREAVPTWGSWCQDIERLLGLRRRLAEEIVRRQ